MDRSANILDKSNVEALVPRFDAIHGVPAYWLYGEPHDTGLPDVLHIEHIETRSSRHAWTIAPHRHGGMLQLFAIPAGGGT